MSKLGEIKRLNVRAIWPNEASDFTPWLAKEDNIARLSTAIGLELEVEGTEVNVGPFSADILARDSGSSDYVIIENQLNKTDHDHLGKAITYAAGLAAGTIVWIAPEFTEEHRKALDWLNDNSAGDVAFYGVQIELWQIEDSKPAVQFNVLTRPAGSSLRAAVSTAQGPLSAARKLQLEWWTAFREALIQGNVLSSPRSAGPRYWFNLALGRTGIHLSCIADTAANRIGVRVYMRNKYNSEAALSQLLAQREQIEEEIGESLIWDPNPDTLDKVIGIYRPVELTNREKWPEAMDWLVDMTAKFRAAFSPRVKQLELDATEESEGEANG